MEIPQAPNSQQTPEQQQADKFKDLHYDFHNRRRGRWFGNIFWGMLVIIVGLIFLSRSLGYTPNFDWSQFWSHIWPVLIIFAGLSILSRGGIVARVVSVILMLLIWAVFVVWLFRIPVRGRIGGRVYRFDPAMMDNWTRRDNR